MKRIRRDFRRINVERMMDLSKMIAKVVKLLEWILALLLFLSIVFILAQVICRYVLRSPLSWTEQTSRYLFIWMIMLGAPITFYRKNPMSFDLLVQSLPAKFKYAVELFAIILIILFSMYYGYQAITLAAKVMGRYTTGVEVPLTFMYSSMAVSNLLIILVMSDQLRIHLGMLKKQTPHQNYGQ